MKYPLPDDAVKVDGLKVSDWMPDPDYDYCSMRILEGSDPATISTRVAFIEKTPRVRFRSMTDPSYDYTNWHCAWKGDTGWDEDSQGWCDQQLILLGYDVPNAKPYIPS